MWQTYRLADMILTSNIGLVMFLLVVVCFHVFLTSFAVQRKEFYAAYLKIYAAKIYKFSKSLFLKFRKFQPRYSYKNVVLYIKIVCFRLFVCRHEQQTSTRQVLYNITNLISHFEIKCHGLCVTFSVYHVNFALFHSGFFFLAKCLNK